MDAFLVSLGLVSLAEIGDKTQLLALLLAARWRRPGLIVAGILVATLLSQALASGLGLLLAHWLTDAVLRWVLGLGFLAMAAWMLVPERPDDDHDTTNTVTRWGVFGSTCVLLFMAELGDKSQVATVALAAQFSNWFAVVAGTTLGMMITTAPAVWIGDRLVNRLPIQAIRTTAAGLLLVLGVVTLSGVW